MALGADVEVGSHCRLLRSVVGPGCRLGDNVTLEDAVLDAGCRLADRCSVKRSLLGPDVRLAAGVRLRPGCVLAGGVSVQTAGAQLPAGTLLVARPPADEFGDGDAAGERTAGETGAGPRR